MNAIIIAAGLGTRLRPLTLETPKPLIRVLEKPMIENSIEILIEKGINEIIIVTGYLADKFKYLEEKYSQVILIENEKYNEFNNIYSFYLAKEYLENSYLLEGDIFIKTNFIDRFIKATTYFSKIVNEENNEWQLKVSKDKKVEKIFIGGKENHILSGVSFFSQKDSKYLKELVIEAIEKGRKDIFWDDLVKENIKNIDINVVTLNDDDIYEIDNLEELKSIDESYSGIKEER